MATSVALIIGAILALGGTIVFQILVMPKKKDGRLPGFLQFLHNYFHFKQLYVETVLKFIFMYLTLYFILGGFFMLFATERGWYGNKSMALYGVLMIFVGPIVLRLIYEMFMMFILLVQNVIDINRKLGPLHGKEKKTEQVDSYAQPQYTQPAYQQPQIPGGKFCPNCGTECSPDAVFCPNCGGQV